MSPRVSARPRRIFRFTSWSEQSTPAELSMKSALMWPPPAANSTRARRVKPRLPPSPTTRQRRSRASTRMASLERSAQDGPDHVAGRQALLVDPERRLSLAREADRLRRPRPDAAALGDQPAV